MYQITKNCVCCHNCATECPMQAIDYVGCKYEIDPDKCVECGLCARVCHTASIINTEDNAHPPAHDLVVKQADVVVCGAGSGLVAVTTSTAGMTPSAPAGEAPTSSTLCWRSSKSSI